MRKQTLYLIILVVCSIELSSAQESKYFSKKEAKHFLEKGDFENATFAYEQLIKEDGEDAKLNYLLGLSLYNSSPDKSQPIPYLKFAAENLQDKKSIDARFLLARAYQLSYDFSNALVQLDLLKNSKHKKVLFGKDLNLLIAQCKTAIDLVKNSQQVRVQKIDLVSKSDLFKRTPFSYEKSDTNIRKLYVKPQILKTLEEAQFKDKLLVLEIEKGKAFYYPEYKLNKYSRLEKDIAYDVKVKGEDFPERMDLGPLLNSNYDENYPYLHTDNKTMYFVSDGPESMGGYDIFKSELDSSTGFWGLPQNLGFPINSVYDEFLYIPNQKNEHVYFSSNRFIKADELEVYKILPPKNYTNDIVFRVNKLVSDKKKTKQIVRIKIHDDIDPNQLVNYYANPNDNFVMLSLPELSAFHLELIYSDSSRQKVDWFTPMKSRCAEINVVDFVQNGLDLEYGIVETKHPISELEKKGIYEKFSKLYVNTEIIKLDTTKHHEARFVPATDSLSLIMDAHYLLKLKNDKLLREKKITSFIWLADQRKQALDKLTQEFDSLKTKKINLEKTISEHENAKLNIDVQKVADKINYNFNEIVIAHSQIKVDKDLLIEMKKNISKVEKYLATRKEEIQKNILPNALLYDSLLVNQLKIEQKLRDKDSVEATFKNRILAIKNLDSLLMNENIKRLSKIGFLTDEKNYLNDELEATWRKRKKEILKREIMAIDKKLQAIEKRQKKLEKKTKIKSIQEDNELDLEFLGSWFAILEPMEYINKPLAVNEKIDFDSLKINQKIEPWIASNNLSPENMLSENFFNNPLLFSFSDQALVKKYSVNLQKDVSYSDIVSVKQIKILPELKADPQEISKVTPALVISHSSTSDSVLKVAKASEIIKNTLNYSVGKGESLSEVAKKFKSSSKFIKKLNQKSAEHPNGIDWKLSDRIEVKKDWIYEGEILVVPDTSNSKSSAIKNAKNHKKQINSYVVQLGDNLSTVAQKHKISVKKLKKMNEKNILNPSGIDWNLPERIDPKLDWIYEGEILIVP